MSKNVSRKAEKLTMSIAEAGYFYHTFDIGQKCERLMNAAFWRADRAMHTGSAADLKKALGNWGKARKCLVAKTGYSHKAKRRG